MTEFVLIIFTAIQPGLFAAQGYPFEGNWQQCQQTALEISLTHATDFAVCLPLKGEGTPL